MQPIHGFSLQFKFPVHFTQDAWNSANTIFFDVIRREEPDRRHRVLAVIDGQLASANPWLSPDVRGYFAAFPDALELVAPPVIVPGAGYWSATITHTQIASFSCGIGVNTTNPIVGTAGDGEPACK